MNSIKVIIVDDEPDAREVLQTLINISLFQVEVVAICEHLKEAIPKIKLHEPDVVFLDIQMPEYAGYEIVNFFDEINFEIVFVTAFDQYALKAFELCALDYLVKPISRDKLNQSLIKVSERLKDKNTIQEYQVLLDSLQDKTFHKIIIPESGNNRVLNLKDIICFQGQGSYSSITLLSGEEVTVSKTLKYFERVLPENTYFFRSQKSWIINLLHVEKFKKGSGDVYLKNNIIAKVSQTKLDVLTNAIERKSDFTK
ncbi:MAG: LytR/AlgR family response regulator transcription factor [Crocinitomicaceae bacterium]